MSFGKYQFESFEQFQEIQNLAMENNLKTAEEFNQYLEKNYSHLKK